MRGRWHGGAVADEVGALASTRRCPPHQSPPATASPHRGSHLSACCRGGAYQDARKVSLVWNARPKHWDLPEFRCSMHPIVTKCSFFPFQTASQTCGLGFIANLRQPLSQPSADSSPERGARGACAFPTPSPMRGRWHGEAVTDEVEAPRFATLATSSVCSASLRSQLPLIDANQ